MVIYVSEVSHTYTQTALAPLAPLSLPFVFKMLEVTVSSVPAVTLGLPLALFNLFNDLVVREAVEAEA